MAKLLLVGDVHATPGEIQDCEALLSLIVETIDKYSVDKVVFLGDQHHCHATLDSRVVGFWTDAIHHKLGIESAFLIGNHDFLTPSIMMPHSMVAHKLVDGVTIVDSPVQLDNTFCCAMPYFYNPEEFVKACIKFKDENPGVNVLLCHQTFMGADEGLGFFSKDAVEPSAVPFKIIISGHIHKPMRLGKVWYLGSPRWRTLSDAEVKTRNICVLEEGKVPTLIPTNTHCVKIYRFEDSELSPAEISLTQDELKRADIRVTINGTSDYISKRIGELKARFNAKCRGVPIHNKALKAHESEGIEKAFQNFCRDFNPPNGTDKETLSKEAHARL
jgi:hypothetical protein